MTTSRSLNLSGLKVINGWEMTFRAAGIPIETARTMAVRLAIAIRRLNGR